MCNRSAGQSAKLRPGAPLGARCTVLIKRRPPSPDSRLFKRHHVSISGHLPECGQSADSQLSGYVAIQRVKTHGLGLRLALTQAGKQADRRTGSMLKHRYPLLLHLAGSVSLSPD